MLAVESAAVRWPDFKAIGLFGSRQAGDECDYEVRMLAPSSGMSEDPITGSLNSALACWLHQQDRLQEQQVMAQGTVIGRHGRVHIGLQQGDEARILIGGHTEILIQGHVVI